MSTANEIQLKASVYQPLVDSFRQAMAAELDSLVDEYSKLAVLAKMVKTPKCRPPYRNRRGIYRYGVSIDCVRCWRNAQRAGW